MSLPESSATTAPSYGMYHRPDSDQPLNTAQDSSPLPAHRTNRQPHTNPVGDAMQRGNRSICCNLTDYSCLLTPNGSHTHSHHSLHSIPHDSIPFWGRLDLSPLLWMLYWHPTSPNTIHQHFHTCQTIPMHSADNCQLSYGLKCIHLCRQTGCNDIVPTRW